MAADKTQSLEYKSIPSTYQSVIFVDGVYNGKCSFYTGDGWVLPLSTTANGFTFDGDITVTDTLYCNTTDRINQISANTSSVNVLSGVGINTKSNVIADTNAINWNNPKSILTDAAVDAKFNELSIDMSPLTHDSTGYIVNDTDKIITVKLPQPRSIVYIIPCLVNTTGNSNGSSLTLQASCNGSKSNIAHLTINTYYEKWRDNPEALREETTTCNVLNNVMTLIGYANGNTGENEIVISESGNSKGVTSWVIDTENVLILSR